MVRTRGSAGLTLLFSTHQQSFRDDMAKPWEIKSVQLVKAEAPSSRLALTIDVKVYFSNTDHNWQYPAQASPACLSTQNTGGALHKSPRQARQRSCKVITILLTFYFCASMFGTSCITALPPHIFISVILLMKGPGAGEEFWLQNFHLEARAVGTCQAGNVSASRKYLWHTIRIA